MSVPESLQRQVECLRLASELTRLAGETSDPVLKTQFLRAAANWSAQADLADGPALRKSGLTQ
ncbi:hypothetical protein [Bradyrhizobium sp.]|uniref:hypothetical protein n=1 Tax=Bradyrhizobium sp. TaxID=376 RepID=UPI0025BA924D|nr:hypothetical protein [Bradyrhizobium sp.]